MRFTISLSLVIYFYIQGGDVVRTLENADPKKPSKYGWFGDNDPEMTMKTVSIIKINYYDYYYCY